MDEGSDEALDVLRHSSAHLMAHAVLDLFPKTQTGIGPAVEDGFFYDFLRDKPFTPEDLAAIEKKMRELSQQDIPIKKRILPKKEALRLFKEQGQELKVELIQEKGDKEVTCYEQGSFMDFCLGPHVSSAGQIKHFKLLSVSGAYWKGDEQGKQLQRIYGTVFFTKKDLNDYLTLLEEAKKRDHRKLGTELDLFSSHEDLGAGLILWHPKGAAVRHVIESYWREEHLKDGYDFLYTPHVAKLDVWRKSGHTEFYDAMYPPMQSDEIEYELKPMNCPFHIMVFNSRQRSYRDLPIRWAELGTVYRYERSGVLHGLMRVRGFTQDDAHIFCLPDQLEEEIKRVIFLALRILKTFGFREYEVFLSTIPEKYVGKIEDWEKATQALEKALKAAKLDFQVDEGEGVFYGPKIDIKIKDALRRSWQCTTIQLDFNLAERFDLSYVGEDGKRHSPFLIHRAILGSLERFFGVLIEHYKGNFPVWLAPVQMIIIPVAERHNDYATSLDKTFKENGLRSCVDLRREKVGYKIRDAEIHKIPLILVVGDKEVTKGTASLRVHTQGDKGEVVVNEFLEKVKELDENKYLTVNL
ncbi:MAG TPA: threonine--tRNA ligase [Candidatus Aminicenantes bacterium]|nr:threonine--tRNA ligase [Candidatus Aminicenantes bacterium]HEB35625.1 threonine--tRNA ligase [Candidatus Aminicenantes bacterium]